MSTFTVVSDDDRLVDRIRVGLARTDIVRQIRGSGDVLVPRPSVSQCELVAIDLRGADDTAVVGRLVAFRQRIAGDRRVAAIVSGIGECTVRVVTATAHHDVDFVLADSESIGLALRALANDQSLTVCAATALEVLARYLLPTAGAVAAVVISSGCSLHSVDSVADDLRDSISTLGDRLRREGSSPPKALIQLAQCVYALALARRTTMNVQQLMNAAGFRKRDRFHKACEARLGGRVSELVRRWPESNLWEFVAQSVVQRECLQVQDKTTILEKSATLATVPLCDGTNIK